MGFVRNRDIRQQEAHIKELRKEVSRASLNYELIDEDLDPEEKEDAKFDLDNAKAALAKARESLKDMKKYVSKFNALFRK